MDFDIGLKIKKLRQNKNMTQKELADKMNVSNKLVSKWETGESIPSVEYISHLCKIFDCEPSFFIDTKKIDKKDKESFKMKKWQKICLVTISLLIFLVCIFLLTYFCFIPAVNKEKYVQEIETSIQNSLEQNKYYNIEILGFMDDEQKNSQYVQGIFDDGQIEFSVFKYKNSFLTRTLKDGIFYKDYIKSVFDSSTINSIEDLLVLSFSYVDDNSYGVYVFDNKMNYVRKVGEDFVFELDKNSFEVEGVKIKGKVKGFIDIKNGIFSSMKIEFVCFDNDNKNHVVKGILNLLDEKPEITLPENVSLYYWGVTDNACLSENEIVESLSDGQANQTQIDQTKLDELKNIEQTDFNFNGETISVKSYNYVELMDKNGNTFFKFDFSIKIENQYYIFVKTNNLKNNFLVATYKAYDLNKICVILINLDQPNKPSFFLCDIFVLVDYEGQTFLHFEKDNQSKTFVW